MFRENVFVCEDFLSTVKKTSYRNKKAFGGTAIKDNWPFNFRDSVNLKLSLHIVHIYVDLSAGFLKKNKK